MKLVSGQKSPIEAAIARARRAIAAVAVFSGVINLLALTGSFYMLQVYDRVLASRSVATLVAISVLAAGLFALQGVLEIVRGQVLSRAGLAIERDLLKPAHALLMRLPLAGRSPAEVTQPVRDMETLRGFATSQGPVAFFDLPWMPLYLVLITFLHPWLGVMALLGMAVLIALTLRTESQLREPTSRVTEASARRQQIVETTRRNAEVMRAMGFSGRAAERFFRASGDLFAASQRVSDVSGTLGSASRVFRVMFQSAMLGLGAYLVLRNEMSAGAIIAASILSGRALAPVEMAIGNWKLFVAARQARARLEEMMRFLPAEPRPVELPIASESVSVENLTIVPPGGRSPILRHVQFQLRAGDGLAVMGPSGAGKSTLARALVGAWPAAGGVVRLDGAPLEQWPVGALGKLIGYLPQDVELFEGSVAENIARLDPAAEDGAVIAAAKAANVHGMILQLPNGYSTMLGEGGQNLSIGQRQRIGLARALYGDPFLVVLDEPNAHLDQEGEVALSAAIQAIRARKGIVVAVSHRRGILESVNQVAVIADGALKACGPRDEVLKALAAAANPAPQPLRAAAGTVQPFPGPMQTGTKLSGKMAGAGPGKASSKPDGGPGAGGGA
jgi:ATP-binding cassette subfamily C protein